VHSARSAIYGTGHAGAPGTWPREVWWALNRTAQIGTPAGRNRWRTKPPFRTGDLLVTAGTPRLGYGRSTHTSGHLSHVPRTVLFAWRGEHLAGRMVAWWCGSRTAYFRFLDEPDSAICPVCVMNLGRWGS